MRAGLSSVMSKGSKRRYPSMGFQVSSFWAGGLNFKVSLKTFIYVYMCVPGYLYVHPYVCKAYRGQKRALDLLELELTISCELRRAGAETPTQVLFKTSKSSYTAENLSSPTATG